MAQRIVVFGATGYTGRLVVERLVAQGARPVLAGRSEERLEALADALGGLEWVRADVFRKNSVFELVGPDDVLVSTVGPFMKHGEPAVRSAVAAGCVYLDTTGEPAFVRRVFDEFGPPAREAGAVLLPAMGYDFAPGALALDEAGEDAVRVDVGYYSLGSTAASLSAGTRESIVGATFADNHAYRDGRVRTVRPAERVRSFEVDGRGREAVSVGGAEHFALPAAYPGLREVNVYLGWFGPLARPVQAGSLLGDLARKLPLVEDGLRFAGERVLSLVPGPAAGTTPGGRSWIAAEAYDAGGEKRSEVHFTGPDAYAFTAGLVAWAAQARVQDGVAGAVGPLQAYGLERLRAGAEAAGLERVVG
jgi:short subunit dehydrogenase-like uncharacterized protein